MSRPRIILDVDGSRWGWPAGRTLEWEQIGPDSLPSYIADAIRYGLQVASGPNDVGPSEPHPDRYRAEKAVAELTRLGFTARIVKLPRPPRYGPGVVYSPHPHNEQEGEGGTPSL